MAVDQRRLQHASWGGGACPLDQPLPPAAPAHAMLWLNNANNVIDF